MILSAGLGTRLRPLTEHCPKALVTAGGISLLERVIIRLKHAGFKSVTINVHHLPDQIIRFLKAHHYFGMEISISDESELLLDSGGGIKKASALFPAGCHILVHNVDVVSDTDLRQLMQHHQARHAEATLAVRDRQSDRKFLFNERMQLCGWENSKLGQSIRLEGSNDATLCRLAFSGIYVLSPDFIAKMPDGGPYSVIDILLKQATAGRILGYEHSADYWADLGSTERLQLFNKQFPNQ
ncbi:MAG TPA: nucleotidyltransferase family protein [Bacteroidales bacterium]|nr:nucleotidyltransferase family protein [Bacteroidales bacterium]HSA43360.1 nucleotidyltransferase family protein [Bacteroidales bacterium]